MFSESLIDSQGDRLSNHTLEPKSGEQNKLESCHEHVGVNNLEQASEMPNDCCKDVCMCDQAGCHPPLAAFDSGKSVFSATSSTFLSAFQYYLSPSFTPSSPPPIV